MHALMHDIMLLLHALRSAMLTCTQLACLVAAVAAATKIDNSACAATPTAHLHFELRQGSIQHIHLTLVGLDRALDRRGCSGVVEQGQKEGGQCQHKVH